MVNTVNWNNGNYLEGRTLSNKKVFVIGELNVDLIMTGDNMVLKPNQEKLVDSFDMVLGSSSAITASGLAGLGLDVYFVGIVGDDMFGHFCIEELKKKGIHTKYVQIVPEIQTGVTVSLSTTEDRALLTYMGSISELNREHIPNEIFDLADHIHFGSFYLQTEMADHWKGLFENASKNKISTSFDTGWDPNENWQKDKIYSLLKYTTLFIPSEVELKHIFAINDINQLKDISFPKYGNVLVKLGEKGSMLIDQSGNEEKVSGYSVTPIDTTGAGDSFNAGAIYGYLNNLDHKELLKFANACGAIATQRIGGASTVPTVEDVQAFQEKHLLGKNQSI